MPRVDCHGTSLYCEFHGPAAAPVLVRCSDLHLLAGAGHASCWEAPAEFNAVVLDFLRRV